MAPQKETPEVYSMEIPPTFPRPPAPGLTSHYLSPQPSQPGSGWWSESSTNGSPITAAQRAALNEAMCKLLLPNFQMPILSPEQAFKFREIFQRRDWTIYQLASLQSLLRRACKSSESIMLEEIDLEETTDSELDSDNDIHDESE